MRYEFSYDLNRSALKELGAAFMPIMIFCIAYIIVSLLACIKIYQKAGYAGWEAIVPVYNSYCMFQMVGKPGWLVFLAFVPIANFAFIILSIYVRFKLVKCFGKSTGFAILSIFFWLICSCILAYSKDCDYQGVV